MSRRSITYADRLCTVRRTIDFATGRANRVVLERKKPSNCPLSVAERDAYIDGGVCFGARFIAEKRRIAFRNAVILLSTARGRSTRKIEVFHEA